MRKIRGSHFIYLAVPYTIPFLEQSLLKAEFFTTTLMKHGHKVYSPLINSAHILKQNNYDLGCIKKTNKIILKGVCTLLVMPETIRYLNSIEEEYEYAVALGMPIAACTINKNFLELITNWGKSNV